MKKKHFAKHWLLLILLHTPACFLWAQNNFYIALSNGAQVALSSPSNETAIQKLATQPALDEHRAWVIHVKNKQLLASGLRQSKILRIESKIAEDVFVISSRKVPTRAEWEGWGIDGIGTLSATQKLSTQLRNGPIPSHAMQTNGKVALLIATYNGMPAPQVKSMLAQNGFDAWEPVANNLGIYQVACYPSDINKLAALAAVSFVQPIAPPDQTLNQRSRTIGRSGMLQAPVAQGGRNLQGANMVVGVGDDTDPQMHPDLMDRLINHSPGIINNHGAHTTGTVAGGGIILPQHAGYAPKAQVVSQWFSGIWQNAPLYVANHNMVVTNNSYGSVVGNCAIAGTYDLQSVLLDEQAHQLQQLLHVFASGNDGGLTCAPFPNSFATVLNAYQSAKNVITTGRLGLPNLIANSSSSGPVKDGRLKPEIIALGGGVVSTIGQFTISSPYYTSDGTSMSAPGVTGGLTLLNERYRQLYSSQLPQGSLMKALLLNGALDMGPAGPDFRYGYGSMHLQNSLRMLEAGTFSQRSAGHNQVQDTVISVPAGLAQLKVLLYWHDQPASVLAPKTLVNDLDLQVIGPNGTSLPFVLNSSPGSVANPATTGEDHVNNSEQVVILNPQAGNYTLRIRGYDVMVNAPQDYSLVFDFVPTGISLSSPFNGESWAAGVALPISWDYMGTGANTFTLEYSSDNGSNWTTIANNIPDTDRSFSWATPADAATTNARIRLTRNGTGETTTSGPFTLIGRPAQSLAPLAEQCEGYIKINWTATTGADGYEVLLKQGPEMKTMATVSAATLTHTLAGLAKDSTYYVAVRATLNGQKGWWNTALERRPNNGNCTGNISDGDLWLDSIPAPISGRQFTSTSLSAATDFRIRIRNLDDAPASGFTIKYSINGAPLVEQNIATPIAAGGTYLHTIPGINMLATGDYSLMAIVKNTGAIDNVPQNDTFRTTVRHLANTPVSLATPLLEGFESLAVQTVQRNTTGLLGTERWDYSKTDAFDRLRTRAQSNIAKTGNNAVTLDVSRATPFAVNPANNLLGTFNLSNYTVSNEVRFDFWFQHHGLGQGAGAQNKVWARGNETDNWVEIYDLGANQLFDPAIYKQTISIELADSLLAKGQQFSASTQIRLGQRAFYAMGDPTRFGGYTFDDLRMYQAENDIQVLALQAPGKVSCALTNATTITISVRNSMSTPLSNIPVSYTINGGAPVNEVIPAIAGNTTVSYSFVATANLSALGNYQIVVAAQMPGDNVPNNNSVTTAIVNQPTIASFPHFQNFENGDANWYSAGTNNSWAYGTPAAARITAAASGTKAWKTNLTGNYNDLEQSYLYSPCFNINGLTNPMLSYSMAYDIEDCRSSGLICDAAWVEYSYDGNTWQKLGASGQGTNWYDYAPGQVWMLSNQTHWHVASIALPKQAGNIRLRFVFNSDEFGRREGVAIDDIHIFDNTMPMVAAPNNTPVINQNVSGSSLVHFTDNGQVVASLNPNGNNLGSTDVRGFFAVGAVRNNGTQYFANRNITVQPANAITGSPATLRLYFSDAEVNEMRMATGCSNCTPPQNYTRLNITQYSDNDPSNEDGSLTNNINGVWKTIPNNNITYYPYSNGYYADFPVSGFSEFWITDGSYNIILPARWVSFDATKQNDNQALLQWQTANESKVLHYEPEVMEPGSNGFISLGVVAAKNTAAAQYQYTDSRAGKTGNYLYRIKQKDADGRVSYSAVRSIQFGHLTTAIKTYPNPATTEVMVQSTFLNGSILQWRITDAAGRLALQGKQSTRQPTEKWRINIQMLPPGVYQLVISDGSVQHQTKLVKVKK